MLFFSSYPVFTLSTLRCNTSQIEPVTLLFRIVIVSGFTQDKRECFEEFVNWLDYLEMSIKYITRQSNGTQEEHTSVKIKQSVIKAAWERY